MIEACLRVTVSAWWESAANSLDVRWTHNDMRYLVLLSHLDGPARTADNSERRQKILRVMLKAVHSDTQEEDARETKV